MCEHETLGAAPWLTCLAGIASPLTVAALITVAVLLIWMAFAPARPTRQMEERLEGYLDRGDVVLEGEMSRPFVSRVVMPPLRGLFGFVGRLLPQGSIPRLQQQLVMAGNPGRMTALDFMGLRLMVALLAGSAPFFW